VEKRSRGMIEVQFLIERECPHPSDTPTNLKTYPAAVFVEWPPAPREPPQDWCDSPHFYRLLRKECRALGYDPRKADWFVCEHMGHLIE
jgi:hypothetical protein